VPEAQRLLARPEHADLARPNHTVRLYLSGTGARMMRAARDATEDS